MASGQEVGSQNQRLAAYALKCLGTIDLAAQRGRTSERFCSPLPSLAPFCFQMPVCFIKFFFLFFSKLLVFSVLPGEQVFYM